MLEDRFAGCLVGVAVGDALGMPVEGFSEREIRQNFGKIADFIAAPSRNLKSGQVTDDTHLTIAIAESILETGDFDPEIAARKFVEWLKDPVGAGTGCLNACKKMKEGIPWYEAGTNSAGCGAAMRVAPLGLYYYDKPELMINHVQISAQITHKDPRAVAGAVAVALAVSMALAAEEINKENFLSRIIDATRPISDPFAESVRNVQNAMGLFDIGTTSMAIHTVPAALYCFLRSPNNFTSSVLRAVNAGGDTDSIAAITGAISGAFNGINAIPLHWQEGVEKGREIKNLAQKLFQLREQKDERANN